MNTESKFTKGQEVWVKARIGEDPNPDRDGEIEVHINRGWDTDDLSFALPSDIRTTEQILQEQGASSPQHNAIKYEYTMTLNGDFAIYQVIKYTATETEAMKELNRLNKEASHFAKETPHNAEPTPQTAVIELAEPDRNRRFKKGDKVQRRKELYGRPLNKWAYEIPFDVIYEVLEDEDPLNNHKVKIEHDRKTYFVSFAYFDLVEPAPEPKYWLHESPKTYSIYYKGQFGRVITAMLMQKDLYTLEEAQEQCDNLNKRFQDND